MLPEAQTPATAPQTSRRRGRAMDWFLSVVPDVSLETANKFYAYGWIASLLGAAVTFTGVVFLMWGTRVRDHDFEHNIAVLHDSAGKARERAGNLEKAAEDLRAKNLELEEVVAPRILEQSAPARA